ncbi:uncharacterized protein CTHT_0050280, partial [Thermochaetoides thermophila DSM 1495]
MKQSSLAPAPAPTERPNQEGSSPAAPEAPPQQIMGDEVLPDAPQAPADRASEPPQPQSSTPTAGSLLRARTEPPRQPQSSPKRLEPGSEARSAARVEPEQEEHTEDCIVVRTSLDSDDESDLAVRHRYQVVCIQEPPPVIFGRVRRHLDFTLHAIDDGATRAAIYVNRRLSTLAPTAPEHGLVTISLQGRTLCSLQVDPNSFIIVGDFNAHHPDWDPRARPNPKGDMVREWIAARGATSRLADPPSDDELKNAFLGATSNTPGPDGVPLAFFRHTWELVRPAARAIAEGCIKWGAFPKAFKQATVVILSKPGRDPSALDLVQALVHDAETMSRQGYHELLVTLDVDSAYPSVQPPIFREVLADQGWPHWLSHHESLRVGQLRTKARGIGLRIDPNKTKVEGASFSPGKSIKWLGVSLDPKLSPATQAAAKASATTAV